MFSTKAQNATMNANGDILIVLSKATSMTTLVSIRMITASAMTIVMEVKTSPALPRALVTTISTAKITSTNVSSLTVSPQMIPMNALTIARTKRQSALNKC